MYLRTVHAEHHLPLLRQFILDNPLGILTTAIPSKTHALLQSSHIPFLLTCDASSETEKGVLRGHMARANPQTKAMIESVQAREPRDDEEAGGGSWLEQEVLVLFNSPVHHYVTPKFYVKTKPETGKVVPTWNYAAVQAYGRAKIFWDAKAKATDVFLAKQLEELSRLGEEGIMGFERPWTVEQAPEAYVEVLKKGIIGIEIQIDRLEGKWKMSQELAEGDREGVVEGFEKRGEEVGCRMAEMVKERGRMKEGVR